MASLLDVCDRNGTARIAAITRTMPPVKRTDEDPLAAAAGLADASAFAPASLWHFCLACSCMHAPHQLSQAYTADSVATESPSLFSRQACLHSTAHILLWSTNSSFCCSSTVAESCSQTPMQDLGLQRALGPAGRESNTSSSLFLRWNSSWYSGKSLRNMGFLRLYSSDILAKRLFSAFVELMLPVVCAASFMKDRRPVRMVPTLHIGFLHNTGNLCS